MAARCYYCGGVVLEGHDFEQCRYENEYKTGDPGDGENLKENLKEGYRIRGTFSPRYIRQALDAHIVTFRNGKIVRSKRFTQKEVLVIGAAIIAVIAVSVVAGFILGGM